MHGLILWIQLTYLTLIVFLGHTVGYYVYVVPGKYEENIEDHCVTDQVKWVL